MNHRLPLAAASLFLAITASADPAPGDVFREYRWHPEGGGIRGRWQRITSPKATAEEARKFLPNAVNRIEVTDLALAARAELQIELLQSHSGTTGQAFRLNGGAWIRIPPSANIPGRIGAREGSPHQWLSMRYPAVPVPLETIRSGINTLEFTCEPGIGLGARWPQSLVNGAILRIYYSAAKPHPSGTVEMVAAADPAAIGYDFVFKPDAAAAAPVEQVDFIGRYRGFDWRGEGTYYEWHYNFRRGELRRHLATASRAPWRGHWDTSWVPDEPAVAVVARVRDRTGLCWLSAPLENVDIAHPRGSRIELFAPHDIPARWHVRAGRRVACKIMLPENLAGLREARLVVATWNGHGAGTIGVNDMVIAADIGQDHDLSYDTLTVPISALRPGENEVFTTSDDKEHGLEVQWPGFVLLARFESRKHGSESAVVLSAGGR
jgi:hypothetical protein